MDVAGSPTGPITSPPGVSLALDLEKVLATSRTLRIPWATAKAVCSASVDVDDLWQRLHPGVRAEEGEDKEENSADFR